MKITHVRYRELLSDKEHKTHVAVEAEASVEDDETATSAQAQLVAWVRLQLTIHGAGAEYKADVATALLLRIKGTPLADVKLLQDFINEHGGVDPDEIPF